jgi:hypothetical protein
MPCGCGTHNDPLLWLIEAAIIDMNPSKLARKLMAGENGYSIDDDPFIRVELLLAATLATSYGANAAQATQLIKDALHTTPLDRSRVDDALKEANKLLSNAIDETTLLKIGRYVDELISSGAKDAEEAAPAPEPPPAPPKPDEPVGARDNTSKVVLGLLAGSAVLSMLAGQDTVIEADPEVQDIFLGMVASSKYYTNNHFNENIMPELQDRIDELISTGDEAGIADIIEGLGDRLASVPYWRVVANAAASRAYHYGLLKGGDLLGATAYEVVALLDERTSAICNYLNGMQFPISDALDQADEIANADPQDLPDISPWLPSSEVIGASVDELMAKGIFQPPYHANCRSTMKLVYDSSD